MNDPKTPEYTIMPSLLAADPGNMAGGCRIADEAGADMLHMDIMDGHFVPNISFGPAVVAMAKKHFSRNLDVHLMLSRPDQYVEAFQKAGSYSLLIHIEAECDVPDTLRDISSKSMRPGIVLNPDTPAEAVFDVVDQGLTDEILCMTVHPGFGGQSFIREVLPKIETLRSRYPHHDISVDGGINRETILEAASAGANYFVMGTSLYREENMGAAINEVRDSLTNSTRS